MVATTTSGTDDPNGNRQQEVLASACRGGREKEQARTKLGGEPKHETNMPKSRNRGHHGRGATNQFHNPTHAHTNRSEREEETGRRSSSLPAAAPLQEGLEGGAAGATRTRRSKKGRALSSAAGKKRGRREEAKEETTTKDRQTATARIRWKLFAHIFFFFSELLILSSLLLLHKKEREATPGDRNEPPRRLGLLLGCLGSLVH